MYPTNVSPCHTRRCLLMFVRCSIESTTSQTGVFDSKLVISVMTKHVFEESLRSNYVDNLTVQPFTSNAAHNKHKTTRYIQGIIEASRKIKAILFRSPRQFLHILAPLVLSHPHLKTTVLWVHHHNIEKRMGRPRCVLRLI